MKFSFGIIAQVDAVKGMYRVSLPAQDDMVTDWLPRLDFNVSATITDHVPFSEGEKVVVALDDHGDAGVVMGAIKDRDHQSPANWDEKKRGVLYADGTEISYDQTSKVLTIKSAGDVIVEAAGNVNLTANTLAVSGDITCTGDITTATGDVKAGLISLKLHTHTIPSGVTGPPQ